MKDSNDNHDKSAIRELSAEDLDQIGGGGGGFDLGQILQQVLNFVSNVATGASFKHWTGPRVQ